MILIPAGEFLMGSDRRQDADAEHGERPQHTLYLSDYYLAKTSVTNAQYAAFVQATGYQQPEHWTKGRPPICARISDNLVGRSSRRQLL
jgi:iron(II)-dependent oxidoreductase